MSTRHRSRALSALTLMLLASLHGPVRADDLAFGGAIVAPGELLKHGWIWIHDGRIVKVTEDRPRGDKVRAVETGGVIFPGFVDLHNHPMYSVFPHWKAPRPFANRYEWRDLQDYKDRIGTPGGELQKKDDQTFCDLDENAEVMAVIGGTTSLTGISPRKTSPPIPDCVAGLVRNLDWASGFYGAGVGHERVKNALGITPRDMKLEDASADTTALSTGALDLLLIHVAEGSSKDMETSLEFLALEGRGLMRPHVGVIHGIGLVEDDFRAMRAADVALIWSPRSNLELYGETTNIPAAVKQGVTIALAPDWSPTGSANMLGEIKYASRYSRVNLGGGISNEQLFEMATSVPARIAGIDDKVGRIAPRLYADLIVLSVDSADPFGGLANARATDVRLVVIGGTPVYGTPELLSRLQTSTETFDVCGKSMALNSSALPSGSVVKVRERLASALSPYKVSLAPLVDCSD
jgi:5-methylthioadenosine/S-adenosylhomocysteine deaminase